MKKKTKPLYAVKVTWDTGNTDWAWVVGQGCPRALFDEFATAANLRNELKSLWWVRSAVIKRVRIVEVKP